MLLGLPEGLMLPNDDVEANRAGDIDRHLSTKASATLRRWYADDYAFLDLCRDHGLFGPAR